MNELLSSKYFYLQDHQAPTRWQQVTTIGNQEGEISTCFQFYSPVLHRHIFRKTSRNKHAIWYNHWLLLTYLRIRLMGFARGASVPSTRRVHQWAGLLPLPQSSGFPAYGHRSMLCTQTHSSLSWSQFSRTSDQTCWEFWRHGQGFHRQRLCGLHPTSEWHWAKMEPSPATKAVIGMKAVILWFPEM